MIKIRVLSDKLNILKGTGKESGKPYEMHIQTAYAYTVDDAGAVAEIPKNSSLFSPRMRTVSSANLWPVATTR